jgi:hypothetical protein
MLIFIDTQSNDIVIFYQTYYFLKFVYGRKFTMYNKQIAEQFFLEMSAEFPIIKILILDAIG